MRSVGSTAPRKLTRALVKANSFRSASSTAPVEATATQGSTCCSAAATGNGAVAAAGGLVLSVRAAVICASSAPATRIKANAAAMKRPWPMSLLLNIKTSFTDVLALAGKDAASAAPRAWCACSRGS